MAQHTRGWVVDGNYRVVGTMVADNATDIVCGFVGCVVFLTYRFPCSSTGLDPPLYYYLPRLLWRTLTRILCLTPLCAEGCKETWGEIFSSQGIVWFCVKKHATVRAKYASWLSRMRFEGGGKMRRLDESRGELARWKEGLEEHLQQM